MLNTSANSSTSISTTTSGTYVWRFLFEGQLGQHLGPEVPLLGPISF